MTYLYDPPDPDPREDAPECICDDPGNPDADSAPDCYYHGDHRSRAQRQADEYI
jgi:hypothetical protein